MKRYKIILIILSVCSEIMSSSISLAEPRDQITKKAEQSSYEHVMKSKEELQKLLCDGKKQRDIIILNDNIIYLHFKLVMMLSRIHLYLKLAQVSLKN